MRASDRERLVNTEAKRVPHDLTCSIHNPDGMNCVRAHLLLRGQFEDVEDQLNGDTEGIMLVALLQEGGLHLVELLL